MNCPIALFDKSFLQSLSVDESVWFDNFFLTNVCPLFYVETLADLEKSPREGQTPEQQVGIIATKFPEMHGTPSVHHGYAILAELMGDSVPMTGQIPPPGGRAIRAGDQTGVVFSRAPVVEAFTRWQQGEFLEVERLFARSWRDGLQALDLGTIADGFRALGVNGASCRTLEEVKAVAQAVVTQLADMKRACRILGIPGKLHESVIKRWRTAGSPPFVSYAPYAAHVLTVEVFFHLAVAANLISRERRSNRVDIAYLYYLPFCMVFVSSDRLHQKCAPLFLRTNQLFVWGQELKADLQHLNAYYGQLPDATKELGIMRFAGDPPDEGEFLVTRICNRFRVVGKGDRTVNPEETLARYAALFGALGRQAHTTDEHVEEAESTLKKPDMIAVQHSVKRRKGSWWQVPKALDSSGNA